MFRQRENINEENQSIKKEPNRDSRVEKYKNCNVKFTSGAYRKIWTRGKKLLNLKTGDYLVWETEIKMNEEK